MPANPSPTPEAHARAARLMAELSERAPAVASGHALAVRSMFDRISPTYDLLNRLLSWGTDRRWRARALSLLAAALPDGPLLDCCAGTLDLARAMQQRWPDRPLLAADFAREMLLAGQSKLSRGAAGLVVCDALRLPFADATFAGMTCGFGMRNLADPDRGVAEAYRVLKPSGVFVVLELFRPTRVPTRLFHAFYGRGLLPLLGRLVSGDAEAYRYLSRSMRGFMTRAQMEQTFHGAGFREVHGVDLTLGVACIVWGVK